MVTANNVPIVPIKRLSTGIDVLDWIWGSSNVGNRFEWGFPAGKLTLLPGEGGLGKTRLSISMVKAFLHKNLGASVLYFQNEALPSDIVGLLNEPQIMVSCRMDIEADSSLESQLYKISTARDRPALVVVDSITMIDEFEDGRNDKKVRHLVERYREVANATGAHILFLSHVTKSGDAKGSTVLPHLVDSVFYAHREKGYDGFVLETGKHRYGQSKRKCYWRYENQMPVGYPSKEMFEDKLWVKDHPMAKYVKPVETKVFDPVAYVESPEFGDFIERVQNFDDPSQGGWLKRKATKYIIRLVARR
jgi:predicted ATP-dependent serine protease